MANLAPIDQFYLNWVKKNNLSVHEYIEVDGWPSERNFEPYFEELQHALNDLAKENKEIYPIPLPDEIMAYNLSKWAGTKVPVNHELIQNRDKWCNVFYDMEYDLASPEDTIQLCRLVHSIAGPELAENLSSLDDIAEHANSPDIAGKLYNMVINDELYYLVVGENSMAIMNQDGEVKAFDFDGNRLHKDSNLPKVQNYLVGGMKFSKPLSEPGELASLVGNTLAAELTGENGNISILDLP